MNVNYVNYLVSQKKSDKTIAVYTTNVSKMLEAIGKNDNEITSMDLMNWQSSLSHMASASINQKVASAKSYFRFLKAFGVIATDPSEQLVPPQIKNKQKQFIDADMIKEMLDNCRSKRDKAVLLVFVTTGIRAEELCSIKLTQYQDMKLSDSNTIISIGKGGKENLVAFNEQTIAAIDDYLTELKQRHGLNSEWLFTGYTGAKMLDNNLNHMIKTTAKRAGLPMANDISAHWLRAACASLMSERGVPVAVIRDTLHHNSIATTSKYLKTNMAQFQSANAMMTF